MKTVDAGTGAGTCAGAGAGTCAGTGAGTCAGAGTGGAGAGAGTGGAGAGKSGLETGLRIVLLEKFDAPWLTSPERSTLCLGKDCRSSSSCCAVLLFSPTLESFCLLVLTVLAIPFK